ncbi:MAG: hypothetical protein WCA19_22500 [Candidatus Acidiferrales bacterium]
MRVLTFLWSVVISKLSLRAANYATLLCLCFAISAFAQDAAPNEETSSDPTKSFFFARTGESLNSPHIGIIHYLEFFQIRKKWIYPDIGYVDFAHGNYREFFIGGGRTLYDGKIASWDQELLYVQATGPAAASARYLQPWSMLRVRFTPKFTSETVYFAYFPLNDSAHIHHVIERAKFEYALKKHWKIGAGYAGVKFSGVPWENKPLLTTTISTKAGAFEFWLQKIPGGEQIEFRYALIQTSR